MGQFKQTREQTLQHFFEHEKLSWQHLHWQELPEMQTEWEIYPSLMKLYKKNEINKPSD